MQKVYSVGYSYAGALEYVKELMEQPKMLLIDTRLKPYSWRANWREEALREDYGKRYRAAGQYLGNLNYRGGPIALKDPGPGIDTLVDFLDHGYDLIILCECQDYTSCHRKVVIELLQEKISFEFYQYSPSPDVETVKCLSIRQPWAYFIAAGLKDIENRDWDTRCRGPVLIHAGVKTESACFDRSELSDAMIARYHLLASGVPLRRKEYVTGAIVGVAELVDVVTKSESRWFAGPYGFVFERARLFKAPVPYAGQLNFFDVPLSAVADAVKRLDEPEPEIVPVKLF